MSECRTWRNASFVIGRVFVEYWFVISIYGQADWLRNRGRLVVAELFANRLPIDPWEPARRFDLIFENGRWKTMSRSGKKFTARGLYIFVVQRERLIISRRITPIGRPDPISHVDLAWGDEVEFAGEARFGAGTTSRGILKYWNDKTGHYHWPDRKMNPEVVRVLPLDCFRPYGTEL